MDKLLNKLKTTPETVEFQEVIEAIEQTYEFAPARFRNGTLINQAGENNGSCKIFAFAQLQQLSEAETLACFGQYYRHDVLQNPAGDDHQNIRNFMAYGWQGVDFDIMPLTVRS